jgi:hypothetical protein
MEKNPLSKPSKEERIKHFQEKWKGKPELFKAWCDKNKVEYKVDYKLILKIKK